MMPEQSKDDRAIVGIFLWDSIFFYQSDVVVIFLSKHDNVPIAFRIVEKMSDAKNLCQSFAQLA